MRKLMREYEHWHFQTAASPVFWKGNIIWMTRPEIHMEFRIEIFGGKNSTPNWYIEAIAISFNHWHVNLVSSHWSRYFEENNSGWWDAIEWRINDWLSSKLFATVPRIRDHKDTSKIGSMEIRSIDMKSLKYSKPTYVLYLSLGLEVFLKTKKCQHHH